MSPFVVRELSRSVEKTRSRQENHHCAEDARVIVVQNAGEGFRSADR